MTSPTPVDVSQTSNEEILQANEFTYLKNNLRLRKLQQDMMEMTTYGSACDELYQWILDKRAYTTHNEKALIACLKAICDKGLDYGPWSAIRVLSKAAEMCGTLTVAGQETIKKLDEEINKKVFDGTYIESEPTPVTTSPPVIHAYTVPPVVTPPAPAPPPAPSPAPPPASAPAPAPAQPSMPVPVNIVSPPLAASSRPVQVPVNPHPVNTNRVTLMSPTVSAASPSASVTSPRVIQIPSTQSSSNNSFSSNQASPIITNTFASPSMKMNTLAVGDTSVSVNSSSTHPIPLGIPGSSPQCTYSSASVTYPNYSNAVNLDTIVQSILEAVPNQLPANSPHSSPRQNKTYPNSGYFQERTNPNYTQKIFNQHIQQQHQQQVHQQYQQQQQQHYQQPHKQPLPIQPLPIQPLQQQLLQQQLLQQHLYQMQQQLQPQLQQQQQQREQMQIQREQMQHLQQQQQREQMQQLQQQQQREQRELTLQLAMASQQHQQQQHYQIFQKQHKGQNIMKNQQYLQEQLQKIQNMTHNRTPSNPEPFRSPQPNEITFAFENNLFTEPEPSSTNKRPKHNHPNNGASLVAAAAATLVEPPRMTERDLMNICRPFENLMEPFKLQGRGYKKARKLFYLSRHMFKRVFLNPDHYHKPMTSEDETPVKFYLFGYNGMAENKCAWPPDVEVSVNNKRLQLSKITKHQSDGYVTQVGKDLPYNLKDQIIAGENELTVSYSHDSAATFVIRSFMYESVNYIVQETMKRTIDAQAGKELIDRLLSQQDLDEGDEINIIQESVKLSLKCPITFIKMKQPVKGFNCKHPQCFELEGYIYTNSGPFPTWKCPHCSHFTPPNELVRDLFHEELLKTLPPYVVEIEYTKDHRTYNVTKMDSPDRDYQSDDDIPNNRRIADPANIINLVSDDED